MSKAHQQTGGEGMVSTTAVTAERRAREFVEIGFRSLGVPSLEPYIAIVAGLIQEAIDAERAWRPIETAPKDGTEILACWDAPALGRTVFAVLRWCAVWGRWQTVPSYLSRHPTHWMPLPSSPGAADITLTQGSTAT